MRTKYNGYWIEEIVFNTAELFMIYPIGSKKPNEYKAVKTLSVKDAKIYIDSVNKKGPIM